MRLAIAALMMGLALPGLAAAEEIGAVDTVFKWLGPNHKIVVEAFDDPMVDGVTCYLSRAKTGGIKGGLGLAEDRAEASIACRQVGPIRIKGKLKDGDVVYSGPAEKPKPVVNANRVGRNDACPCGSGKKFKKCCGA